MTLDEKIKLIDDLIRENTDITIAEYLFSVAEIENVEKTTSMDNRKGIANLSDEEKVKILAMAQTYNAKEISLGLGLSLNQVYKVCAKVKGGIKAIRHPEAEPAPSPPIPPAKRAFVRPPAQYSNHSPMGIAS